MKQKTEQIIIVYDNIRNKQAIETQSILVIFFNKNIYVALCYDLYVFYLVRMCMIILYIRLYTNKEKRRRREDKEEVKVVKVWID